MRYAQTAAIKIRAVPIHELNIASIDCTSNINLLSVDS